MSKIMTFPALAAALSLLALPAAHAASSAQTVLLPLGGTMVLTKHGADDPAGDDRGGKGRSSDDGANHAFNNNTNAARYNKQAADLAWGRTIAWFKKYLK